MAHDFTQGSVGKKLLLFSLPIMAGMVLQTAYNIIDTVFIGMLGPEEIAAVSLTFPVVFVFIAVASGLGIGANALVSQAVGKGDIHTANNFAEHALFLAVGLGISVALLGLFFSPVVFTLMGADQELLPLTMEYAVPIFFGVIFMFAWFISDSILRAEGNSVVPMRNLAFSVVLNIVLDPLLIFGFGFVPAMGLFGAAFATVLSRAVAAGLNFFYIYSPKSVIKLSLREFKPYPECVKRMVFVGLPASASQALTAAGFMFLMGIVGSFGSLAIAAFGIGLRVNSVGVMPVVGMWSAVSSMVGQNFGAGNYARARRVALLARRITLGMSLLVAAAVLAFPSQIMLVFTQDPEVVAVGTSFLEIVPFAFILYGAYWVFFGAFQGTGKTHYVLAINFFYWLIAVASAFFLSQAFGLRGVWLGFVIAPAVEFVVVTAIFVSGSWFKAEKKKRTFVSCMP
jgi:putative MATE family efflux protein